MLDGRNGFIDFSKGALIVLVVTGHVLQLVIFRGFGALTDPLFQAIYMFHMPLFMAVSGYLAQRARAGNWILYGWEKTQVYVVPALMWTTTQRLVLFAFVYLEAASQLQVLWVNGAGSVFAEQLGKAIIESTSLWFLWVLWVCVLLVAALRKTGRWFWPAFGLVFVGVLFLPENGSGNYLKFLLPFFMIGYRVAETRCIEAPSQGRATLIAGMAALAGLSWWLWDRNTYVYVTTGGLFGGGARFAAVRYIAGISMSVVALWICRMIYDKFGGGRAALEFLGRESLGIYASHGLVLGGLARVIPEDWIAKIGLAEARWMALPTGFGVAVFCAGLAVLLKHNKIIGRLYYGQRAGQEKLTPAVNSDPATTASG
jgi:fucose 4-O-acetylase-like acetyltransferase